MFLGPWDYEKRSVMAIETVLGLEGSVSVWWVGGRYICSPSRSPITHFCVCFFPQVLTGPHYYTWGDHGGILMAVTQGSETDQLK